ncbi:MAG: hypothetical protein WBB65_02625 [Anaerolineales bacterium]
MDQPNGKKFSLDNLTDANRWLVISAVASLICFFLPWIVMRGFFNSTASGLYLFTSLISRASGLPLGLVLLTPISALVALILNLPKLLGKRQKDEKLPRNQMIIMIVMIAVGFLPFILIPFEMKTWSGGEVKTGYGLWIAIIAQIGMLFYAYQGSTED